MEDKEKEKVEDKEKVEEREKVTNDPPASGEEGESNALSQN